uniref:Sulfur carrier protein FdhD n=2 Tax=environmental samples TaxID=48479 RepID=C7FPK1_9BACT|nr:uncharacterized protein [uncultured bacterium HF186_25m_18N5]ACU26504.1 uncharacterized protein [uncultured bacterium HF186_25m_27D22]
MNHEVETMEVSVLSAGARAATPDDVIVEAPLELRVDGEPLAVLMRTPGDDRALCAGFLLTEGVIELAEDLESLGPCTDPNRPNAHNTYLALLAPGGPERSARVRAAQRDFYAASSCGICGKATIESIHQRIRPHKTFHALTPALIEGLGERARQAQPAFTRTGGCHGAVAYALSDGETVLASAEDVGRHNAVDKVIGDLLLQDKAPVEGALLWISGRASFEVVQKALVGGFQALVCVGAPTSLAVEMAQASRLTLVGFATRSGRYNLYAGAFKGE